MNHTMESPTAAATAPPMRNCDSGVVVAASSSLLPRPGAKAQSEPSIHSPTPRVPARSSIRLFCDYCGWATTAPLSPAFTLPRVGTGRSECCSPSCRGSDWGSDCGAALGGDCGFAGSPPPALPVFLPQEFD